MKEDLIIERKKILNNLDGISEPIVENKEWLYLLKEETRNSILIEGYFVNEEELKYVLSGNRPISKSQEEAIRYFKTAKFVYSLAYENFKSKDFLFGIPLIRQINKELGFEGDFRKGKVKITGTKFEPPNNYIEDWLRIYVEFINKLEDLEEREFFNKLAVSHAFFEEIHPFVDGNGRTGRILLNYILISKGYPLVIIKSDEKGKKVYYKGLEEVDMQLSIVFKKYNNVPPNKEEVLSTLKNTKSEILKSIILETVKENIDRLIIEEIEKRGEKLEPVGKLLKDLGYSSESARQLIKRGKIIAIKKGKSWYSTKSLVGIFLKKSL